MLKRTMMLLGLTITVGALLLVIGCGGSNNPVSENPTLTTRGGQPPSSPQLRVGVTTLFGGYRYIGARSVDPEGDRIKYRIEVQGPVNLVFDQTKDDPDPFYPLPWSNQPVSDFASGQWGFVKLPSDLPSGSYVIKAQAFDGNQWGPNNQLSIKF